MERDAPDERESERGWQSASPERQSQRETSVSRERALYSTDPVDLGTYLAKSIDTLDARHLCNTRGVLDAPLKRDRER